MCRGALSSFRLGRRTCVATQSLEPSSLGSQTTAVQSHIAALKDPQPRPQYPRAGGFHKGSRERKGHCLLLQTEDSCPEATFSAPSPSLMIQIVQAFSLMPQGWRAHLPDAVPRIVGQQTQLQRKALVTHPHLLCQESGLFLTPFPGPLRHYLDSGPRIEVKQVTTGDCPQWKH